MPDLSQEVLQAALSGLEAQRETLDEQIGQVRSLLGSSRGYSTWPVGQKSATRGPSKKRTLSRAARKRIADAQKKRWAEFKRKKRSGK